MRSKDQCTCGQLTSSDGATSVVRAAGQVERLWSWTPAANNVRELVAADIDILSINESTIANISVTTPDVAITVLVGSNNHVAITGDPDDLIPVARVVCQRLVVLAEVSSEPGRDAGAEFFITTERRGLGIAPEALVLLEARTPQMVMEFAEGRGMTVACIEGLTFVLNGINIAASQGVVNVPSCECNAGCGAERLRAATGTSVASWRTLAIAAWRALAVTAGRTLAATTASLKVTSASSERFILDARMHVARTSSL